MVLLVIIVLILGFLIYANSSKNINNIQIEERKGSENPGFLSSWPYTNLPKDVLLNPYDAPYRDERYFINSAIPINAVPINVATNIGSVPTDTSYRQMGIITPLNGESKDNILPLMGKPLLTNRDKWQYYTISNQHNNVKLPISFKGRSALNDYGVDQIFSGDTVYVEGYNDAFRVTVYENDTIKYLPFL